jgi:hypothetical protein
MNFAAVVINVYQFGIFFQGLIIISQSLVIIILKIVNVTPVVIGPCVAGVLFQKSLSIGQGILILVFLLYLSEIILSYKPYCEQLLLVIEEVF